MTALPEPRPTPHPSAHPLPRPRIPILQPAAVNPLNVTPPVIPPCLVRPRPAPDVSTASDSELAAIAAQDAEAFAVLYDRYAGQIFRTVYRRLGVRADAEDVTAEVFVKAFSGIDGYRPARAPFAGWLHRIAVNAVVDHLRARRAVVPLDAVPDAEDPRSAVEEQALHNIEADHVWRVVAGLTSAQRTAITLRLGRGLPIADVAGRMQRSEGAVKLLLNRGLAAVRAQLADVVCGPLPAMG